MVHTSITNPNTGKSTKIYGSENVANYYSTLATNNTNMMIAKGNNMYNKLMQDEQNRWNLEQWQRQNAYDEQRLAEQREYDSPFAQRQRLIDAGYNPLMLDSGGFGGGGSSQPNTTPMQNGVDPAPADSIAAQQPNPFINMFDTVMRSIGVVTQSLKDSLGMIEMPQYLFNDQQRADAEFNYKNAVANSIIKEMPWIDRINYGKEIDYYAGVKAKEAAANASNRTANFIEEQTKWFPRLSEAQIHKFYSSVDNDYSDISVNEHYSAHLDAESAQCFQEILESRQRIRESKANIRLISAKADEQEFENEMLKKYGEQTYQNALRAADDAHADSLTNRFMKMFDVPRQYRPQLYAVFQEVGLLPEQEQKEFFDVIRRIKSEKDIPTTLQADYLRWVNTLFSLPVVETNGMSKYTSPWLKDEQ